MKDKSNQETKPELTLFPQNEGAGFSSLLALMSLSENQDVVRKFVIFSSSMLVIPFIALTILFYLLLTFGTSKACALNVSCIVAISMVMTISFAYAFSVYKEEMQTYYSDKKSSQEDSERDKDRNFDNQFRSSQTTPRHRIRGIDDSNMSPMSNEKSPNDNRKSSQSIGFQAMENKHEDEGRSISNQKKFNKKQSDFSENRSIATSPISTPKRTSFTFSNLSCSDSETTPFSNHSESRISQIRSEPEEKEQGSVQRDSLDTPPHLFEIYSPGNKRDSLECISVKSSQTSTPQRSSLTSLDSKNKRLSDSDTLKTYQISDDEIDPIGIDHSKKIWYLIDKSEDLDQKL